MLLSLSCTDGSAGVSFPGPTGIKTLILYIGISCKLKSSLNCFQVQFANAMLDIEEQWCNAAG